MIWHRGKIYYNVAELYNEAASLVSAGYVVDILDYYGGWTIHYNN